MQYVATACCHCGGKFELPEDGFGLEFPCPHCKRQLILDNGSSQAPSPLSKSLPTFIKLWKKQTLARVFIASLIGLFFCFGVAVVFWNSCDLGNSREVIQQAEKYLAEFVQAHKPEFPSSPSIFDGPPPERWNEFKTKFDGLGLSHQNKRIAIARASCNLSVNPGEYDYEWNQRLQYANEQWQHCETSTKLAYTIMVAIITFICVTLVGYMVPLLISWIWYFLLDRISEFSGAVRGK